MAVAPVHSSAVCTFWRLITYKVKVKRTHKHCRAWPQGRFNYKFKNFSLCFVSIIGKSGCFSDIERYFRRLIPAIPRGRALDFGPSASAARLSHESVNEDSPESKTGSRSIAKLRLRLDLERLISHK